MSLWAKTQTLPQEYLKQLQHIYLPNQFPLEVRHYLADWLEQVEWHKISLDDPQFEVYALGLLNTMVEALKKKGEEYENEFIIKMKFNELAEIMKNVYSSNPFNLVRVVLRCLTQEQNLVQQAESATLSSPTAVNAVQSTYQNIKDQIQALVQATQVTESKVKGLQHQQEQYIINTQSKIQIDRVLEQLSLQEQTAQTKDNIEKIKAKKQEVDMSLVQMGGALQSGRIELTEMHKQTFEQLGQLQRQVIDEELKNWKRQQQLSGNGVPFDMNSLEKLQEWCEALAELTWLNRQQVKKEEMLSQQLVMTSDGQQDSAASLQETITQLLSHLVTRTFIVETQPSQVLKKDSRFTSTVRMLVGGKLNVHMNPPEVIASIISESHARALESNQFENAMQAGDILNNKGTMEYNQANSQLSVTFRNMQLKKIKRSDKKGQEAVTDEKFCLLFQSTFTLGVEKELIFKVWTMSLPVVVTVHGNQECNAMGTILWDNAFSEPSRQSFIVPDTVMWSDLAHQLNCKFQSFTGRGLTQDNCNYLATKLFGGQVTDDFSNQQIKWCQFNKDSLTNRHFTFWDWFHAVMKLVKDQLRPHWNDGTILGFIGKQQSQEQLMAKPNSTFLLRFSDSEIGGITIAWVANSSTGETQVWNLHPWIAKDFAIRSLADRIKDLHDLVWLYPDIPKDRAFASYYTKATADPVSPSQDGYIKSHLINVINTGIPNAQVLSMDNPQTPQLPYPQSPSECDVYETMTSMSEASNQGSTMDSAAVAAYALENAQLDFMTDYGTDDIDSIVQNAIEKMT